MVTFSNLLITSQVVDWLIYYKVILSHTMMLSLEFFWLFFIYISLSCYNVTMKFHKIWGSRKQYLLLSGDEISLARRSGWTLSKSIWWSLFYIRLCKITVHMYPIFNVDISLILYSSDYSYFAIFGLSVESFKKLLLQEKSIRTFYYWLGYCTAHDKSLSTDDLFFCNPYMAVIFFFWPVFWM